MEIPLRHGGNPTENTAVNMIRPHLRDIPQVSFPPGFGIRAMRLGEAALWTEVQRAAERLFPITDDLFTREFGDDLPATLERCFLLTIQGDAVVGTISAWYSRVFRGQDYGRIHWVAVRPEYQGRGLAKAALSHALTRMTEWHERAWLATSTARPIALRLYLDFGFLPDLEPPGARAAWEQVQQQLTHPILLEALRAVH